VLPGGHQSRKILRIDEKSKQLLYWRCNPLFGGKTMVHPGSNLSKKSVKMIVRIFFMPLHLANPLIMHDNMGMYRKHLLRPARLSILVFAAGILFAALPSFGQKADVNVNIYGTFPSTATGSPIYFNGQNFSPVTQNAAPSAGFRIGGRYIFSPIFGLEVNYGYNRATQYFVSSPQQSGTVYSHAKPFTIDYVATAPHVYYGLKPFVLAGAGFIDYNISSFSALPARAEKIPIFEYGLGADYHPTMFPNFMSLRFQYRGLVGHAPDYLLPYLATTNLINIAEPQAGLVFKF